jgi:hypothetical protein
MYDRQRARREAVRLPSPTIATIIIIMSTAAQRKAWNDAMRSAGAVLPTSSARTAYSAAIDRRRKRREGARKASSMYYGESTAGGAGGASSMEEREYSMALRLDMLEGVVGDGTTAISLDVDDDDYDEFAELDDDGNDDNDGDDDNNGKPKDSKGKFKKKRKRKGAVGGTGKNPTSSVIPKYLKPRSLASILMEEAGRPDSIAGQYVNASVRRRGSGRTTITRNIDSIKNNTVITTTINPYPPRKFCPVTGLYGAYTEPKSGIPYATLSALEQIRERPPPWMNAGNNAGSASYWEAVKSLQNDYC